MLVQTNPKPYKFLLFLILLLAIPSAVSAIDRPNYTTSFGANDVVHYNTSFVMDTGQTTPWELWIASGLIGLILFMWTMKSRENTSDVEIDAIVSIAAWAPIAYCSYASFAVDRLTAYGVTSQFDCAGDNTLRNYVLLEQHTIYSEPIIGIIMAAFLLVAIGNTFRIIMLHKALRGGDE